MSSSDKAVIKKPWKKEVSSALLDAHAGAGATRTRETYDCCVRLTLRTLVLLLAGG